MTLYLYETIINDMGNISKELDAFSELELAYFIRYRLQTLDEYTRRAILKYLREERDFALEKVDDLITSDKKQRKIKGHCPRCNSNRVVENNRFKYCEVCSKSFKENKIWNILYKIWDYIPY